MMLFGPHPLSPPRSNRPRWTVCMNGLKPLHRPLNERLRSSCPASSQRRIRLCLLEQREIRRRSHIDRERRSGP